MKWLILRLACRIPRVEVAYEPLGITAETLNSTNRKNGRPISDKLYLHRYEVLIHLNLWQSRFSIRTEWFIWIDASVYSIHEALHL